MLTRRRDGMTKRASIAEARKLVGRPQRTGACSWIVIGPCDLCGTSGRVERQYNSYWAAASARTEWVAEITLTLMGYESQDETEIAYYVHTARHNLGGGNVEDIVSDVLEVVRRGATQ